MGNAVAVLQLEDHSIDSENIYPQEIIKILMQLWGDVAEMAVYDVSDDV